MALFNFGDCFMESEGSDIKIRVRTQQEQKEFEVPGHSYVIRRSSTLLKTILEAENVKESKIILLELKAQGDIEDGMTFLRYIYSKDLEQLDTNSYVALLRTAYFYDVKDLYDLCEKRIRHTVSPNSVCKIYATLEKLATEECLKFFLDLMLKSAFHIFENKLHISLHEETLKLLLESDQLNVLDERQAVTAILWWAKARAAAENEGEDYVKCKTDELMSLVRWSFVQNCTEFDPWCKFKTNNNDDEDPSDEQRKPNLNFSLKKYCNVLRCTDGLISVSNVELTEPVLCIQFAVNRDTFLTGLGLHVETESTFTGDTRVNIYYNGSYAVQSLQMKETKCGHHDTNKNAFHRFILVEFDKPLLVKKNVGFNEITMTVCHDSYHVLGPLYKTHSGMSHSTKISPGSDIEFTVCGEVIAIEELYYLHK